MQCLKFKNKTYHSLTVELDLDNNLNLIKRSKLHLKIDKWNYIKF